MTEFIRHLIALNEWRSGKPGSWHELKFILEWIHTECLMRWPDTTKRIVFDTVTEIDGYQFKR